MEDQQPNFSMKNPENQELKKKWIDPEITEVQVIDYTRGGVFLFSGRENGVYKVAS